MELERGEWQISRMYTVLNRPQSALWHAKGCLEICKENNIRDWDIAFAYEVMARAYAVAEQKTKCRNYIELANKAVEQIKEKGDRDYLLSELKTITC